MTELVVHGVRAVGFVMLVGVDMKFALDLAYRIRRSGKADQIGRKARHVVGEHLRGVVIGIDRDEYRGDVRALGRR
jgi:hypothetical protein